MENRVLKLFCFYDQRKNFVIQRSMELKFYSIKHYIHCIDKLKIPYPEDSLIRFLDSYKQKLIRETSPSLIFFNGHEVVIEKDDQIYMKNKDIEDMLYDLLKYHKKNSKIHKTFLKFIDDIPAPKIRSKPLDLKMIKDVSKEKFNIHLIKNPKLDIHKRWEIGIRGNNSIEKISTVTKEILNKFPNEIYMFKILKKEFEDQFCSRAEIYLETEELNIQNILDEMHEIIKTFKLKPSLCADKPKFMSTIPNEKECIFCFSQGGEDVYQYKETATQLELETLFDGDSYYKFIGTLDVGIDIQRYLSTLYMIKEIGDIMQKIGKYDPKSVDALYNTGNIGTTEKYFTKLLYADHVSINFFRSLLKGKSYEDISFLHGLDSTNPIVIVMKPGFENNYKNKVTAPSIFKKNSKVDLNIESSNFSFRYPKSVGDDKCKDMLTWCNSKLIINGKIGFYDIDSVFIPAFLEYEFQNLNSISHLNDLPNPFKDRIKFYGKDISKDDFLIKGDEAYQRSLAPLPDDNYYLSYNAFINLQKEYMNRLAYYGFYINSSHKFK